MTDFSLELYSDVKCNGGTPHGLIVDWLRGSTFADSLAGDAASKILLTDESPILPFLALRKVLRFTGLRLDGVRATRELRIRNIHQELNSPIIEVMAMPMTADLADVKMVQTLGGVPTYVIDAADLTTTEWITNYVLPALAAQGLGWIDLGTIGLDPRQTRNISDSTVQAFLLDLTAKLTLTPRLRQNGDTNYLLDVTELGASAAAAQLIVGRNVETLEWSLDGLEQATEVLPRGVTPSGEQEPRGADEYAAQALGAGFGTTATDLAITDPDTPGAPSPLHYDHQHENDWLEFLVPPLRVKDLLTLHAENDSQIPQHVVLRSTGSTRELWISSGNNKVLVYDALTRLLTGVIAGLGAPGGMLYHAGSDRIYVCNGATGVYVLDPVGLALVTTITVGSNPVFMAYAPTQDRIHVYNSGGSSVSVINPSTQTVVATVGGLSTSGDICYDAQNARIVVACPDGNAYFINPATNAIVNTLAVGGDGRSIDYQPTNHRLYIGRQSNNDVKVVDGSGTPSVVATITATGLSAPKRVFADGVNGLVFVLYGTGFMAEIAASTNTVNDLGLYLTETGFGKPGCSGLISEQGIFWIPLQDQSILLPWCPTTRGQAIRRQISDSVADTTQLLSIGTVAPITEGDVVSFKRDAQGTLSPAQRHAIYSQQPPNGYGIVHRELTLSDRRGERNYVLDAFGDDRSVALRARYWSRNKAASATAQPALACVTDDLSSWTGFNAQADGAQSATSQVLLKGLTPGDILQPGDWIGSIAAYVAQPVTVDGAGKATVQTWPSPWTGSITNGQTIAIARSGLKNFAPFLNDFYANGGERIVLPADIAGATQTAQTDFPLPFYQARSTLACVIEVYVWPVSGFQPSTSIDVRLVTLGGLVLATATNSDTTTYADGIPRTYTFTILQSLTDNRPLAIQVRSKGSWIGGIYVKQVRACLSTEAFLTEHPRVNASAGALYHATHTALDDFAKPPVHYVVSALEDDPSMPLVLGGRVILEHPAANLVATPRLVSIQWPLPDSDTGEERLPTIELDNRSKSLARLMAEAGIS